jgi:glycosyltransferase involved in cell wall biosynthesis
LLVDPYSPEAIADALLKLAGDPELQARLKAAGYARAAGFRWEDAAAATWKLLEEAAA